MLKYTLIYLWVYIGIHGAVEVEAGDADEHVHIKLHMPKTAVRKSLHRNHVRHKKNPPPYVSSSPHGHDASVSGPGAAIRAQHSVYHEAPHHNYLTAMGTHSMHGLHHHHMTQLQPIEGTGNGGQQQLLDAQYYASAAGTGSTGAAELGGLLGDTDGGEYMAYLTKSFASFPQPTFETETISSPMANGDLAYQQAREEEEDYQNQHQHHYTAVKHHHRQPYEMAAASVVTAANHELDEDNEILGPMGRTSSLLEQSEWSPQHQHPAKLYRGGLSSSVKALKNEHLLRQAMQQQQKQQQHQHLYPDMENNQEMQSEAMQRSRNRYRDEKLYKETLENARDDTMEVMNTYEDMDMEAVAHRDDDDLEGRHRSVGAGHDGGITPLTVDDIWSQLQRQYLNKYTPQAQPNEMQEEEHENTSLTSSKKQKRNSQKIKTRKRHYQSKAATPTTAATVRTLSIENNYHNQEHHGKPSTFYDSHTPQSSSYGASYAAFSPFSSSHSISSSPSPTEGAVYSTRATSATRPSYQNFKTFSNFDDNAAAGGADEEDNNEDEEDAFASNDDVSSEESVFSSSHKKYGNNRSNRHNHGSVAYGHADTLNNNPFNYQDLYASYSTPIAQATIATYPNYQASTYHPNSYNIAGPTPSSSSSPSSSSLLSSPLNPQTPHQQQVQAIYPTGHESTSYQWREQQHYPASYQSYHTSSHQQQRPQQQHLQQSHPHTQQYQPQTSSALRLPKATVASASLSQHHPLTAGASSSSSSSSLSSSPLSPILSTNDFTSAVKQSSIAQQQRNKKRKNRLKSKRNRIVVI